MSLYCVSLPRSTTSSDWKFVLFVKFKCQHISVSRLKEYLLYNYWLSGIIQFLIKHRMSTVVDISVSRVNTQVFPWVLNYSFIDNHPKLTEHWVMVCRWSICDICFYHTFPMVELYFIKCTLFSVYIYFLHWCLSVLYDICLCHILQMVELLQSKPDFVGQLLQHMGTSAIMDLLLRLITCIESPECRAQCIAVSMPHSKHETLNQCQLIGAWFPRVIENVKSPWIWKK